MAMVTTAKFPERNEMILALYDKGLTFVQIARQTGATRNAVAGVLNRAGKASRGGKKFPFEDLSGRRYGRLTVLRLGPKSRAGFHRYYCICDCGKERLVQVQGLRGGYSKSCGCLRDERSREHNALRKISTDDPVTLEIAKLRSWGWSFKEIAQALEIAPSTAWRRATLLEDA